MSEKKVEIGLRDIYDEVQKNNEQVSELAGQVTELSTQVKERRRFRERRISNVETMAEENDARLDSHARWLAAVPVGAVSAAVGGAYLVIKVLAG